VFLLAYIHCLFSVVVSHGFDFVFSVLAKRWAVKSISKMTCFMLNGTLNLNSVN